MMEDSPPPKKMENGNEKASDQFPGFVFHIRQYKHRHGRTVKDSDRIS